MYKVDLEEKVLKYLPLVKRVVNKIGINNIEYTKDDLISIGVIGLMDAINKFDITRQVPFEAYATFRIRGAIIDEVRKHAKISRNKMTLLNEFYKTKNDLSTNFERDPTDNEIATKMNISLVQLNEIYDSMHFLSSLSLDNTLFTTNEDDGLTLKDIIIDQTLVDGQEMLEDEEKKDAMIKSIAKLPNRDQIILNLYYVENLTLKEIAEVLDISTARVSQLHGKIVLKLKILIEEELA